MVGGDVNPVDMVLGVLGGVDGAGTCTIPEDIVCEKKKDDDDSNSAIGSVLVDEGNDATSYTLALASEPVGGEVSRLEGAVDHRRRGRRQER